MSEKKQRRRKALASGIGVAVAIFGGLFATGLAIGSGGGKPSVAGDTNPPEAPEAKDWAAIAGAAMASTGFDFAVPAFAGGVLTINGDAPDALTRTRAYDVGVKAVINDKAHVGQVLAFENAITVAGQTVASVPDAASALGEAPKAQACQTAYDTLLKGRVINFGSGSAVLADESKPLLDALAAVTIRCETYRVELGGHTDAQGDETANQTLSERRAQSVADYLVSKSVPAPQLGVNGFGETMPLDTSGSSEADAKNRRIEFKVVEGTN
jgi:outer membrane protein OmpA-like peptidoglycan-associated protein